MEDYEVYSQLTALPKLVRQQRRLEAKIAPIVPLVDDEKAVRKSIDLLLVSAGIVKGDGVRCLGYDVVHNERKGQTTLNQDALLAALIGAGVDRALALDAIACSMETGEPAKFATVKPSKGSKVRTA